MVRKKEDQAESMKDVAPAPFPLSGHFDTKRDDRKPVLLLETLTPIQRLVELAVTGRVTLTISEPTFSLKFFFKGAIIEILVPLEQHPGRRHTTGLGLWSVPHIIGCT